MIKQTAIVTSTEGDIAHVKVYRQSTCGQCGVQKGCGTSVFSKVLGNKLSELVVSNPIHAEKGDIVILGMYENVLIKSALLMYLFPLFMMFFGAIIVTLADRWLDIGLEQGWVILSSFIFLLLAFIYIRKTSKKYLKNDKYQPAILSKATLSDIQVSPFKITVN